MKSIFFERLVRLARSLWRRPAGRTAARRPFRPAVESLEDRAVPSTLTVANLNDSGVGSLRYELAQAGDGDTIVFNHRLHGVISLTSGELQVGRSVTIQGPGADRLAVSGGHASRVFEILSGANVCLSGLTVKDGVANPSGSDSLVGLGGGIAVDRGATLTLTAATVSGNTANAASATSDLSPSVLGNGGGIYNAGTLTMIADIVRCNTANSGSAAAVADGQVDGIGGGVYNAGTLSMSESHVAANVANAGASSSFGAGEGGGIYSSGVLTLTNDSVSGNTANAGPIPTVAFTVATGLGGGLMIAEGTATVQGSVFADDIANAAVAGAVIVEGMGGGITNQGRLTVSDTLFTGDVANAASASGPFRSNAAGYGGGIDNNFGQMTATGVAMFGNTANAGSSTSSTGRSTLTQGFGGGIYGGGMVSVIDSNISGNTANSGSSNGEVDAQGGGILDVGPLTLKSSVVLGNVVNTGAALELHAAGGGVWAAGGTIADSIIAFNVVNAGGGIPLIYVSGGGIEDTRTMTVSNTVVAFNDVNTDPASGHTFAFFSTEDGGGIDVDGGSLTLTHSSVAGNFALDVASDISMHNNGQVDPASANNLIGAGGSGGLVNGVNGNVVL
jgi:hypothetical protein